MLAFSQRLFRIIGSVVFIFTAVMGPANADATLDKKVAEAGEQLAKASAAAEQALKDLKATQAQLPAARKALEEAQVAEAEARVKYQEAQTIADAAQDVYAQALGKLSVKQAEIDILQKKVDQFARAVYQQGQTTQIGIILSSTSPTDLTLRLQAIKTITRENSASLSELTEAKKQLAIETADAELKRIEADRLATIAHDALIVADAAADKATKAKAKLDELIAKEAEALRIAEEDKARVKKIYDALLAEQKRVSGIAKGGSSGSGDPYATGPLSWPLPGYRVTGFVGPRIHPVYGYTSCHTGIDIAAPSGTPIRAADSGIIISKRWSTAYGNMLMIDHGDGLVTMYAHMSGYAVNYGQSVGNGQVVGYVGSTGWSTGPHLHFEVHINGVPYDPMGWFGGTKKVVSCWK